MLCACSSEFDMCTIGLSRAPLCILLTLLLSVSAAGSAVGPLADYLNKTDQDWNTPLHLAVMACGDSDSSPSTYGADVNMVRLLLMRGADDAKRNKVGLLPLDYANHKLLRKVLFPCPPSPCPPQAPLDTSPSDA